MEERACVVEVHADHVVVESLVKSTCSQCQQVDNCGSGIVAKAIPQPKLRLEIATAEQFDVGEQVLISIPEQTLLSVAWRVYLWPIIGLMFFSGLAHYGQQQGLFDTELVTIVFGILGGYLGYRLSKHHINADPQQQMLIPTIKQRLITTQALD